MYAPHILQVKVDTEVVRDEYGRPVVVDDSMNSWADVCCCRCDDNSTKEFVSENGTVYRPNYHVVCSERVSIKEGDIVRCLCGAEIVGDGVVYMVKHCNYFWYSELWM